jgi:hypothetical protein
MPSLLLLAVVLTGMHDCGLHRVTDLVRRKWVAERGSHHFYRAVAAIIAR